MKETTYVILIALLAPWTVVNANKEVCPLTRCPPREKYASNLPHETDCTKFYKCNWGFPILQDCPLAFPGKKDRLHYNRRLQVCDWPWLAGCESCPKPIKGDSCAPPKISNPKDNCNTYYECKEGKPDLKKCPDGKCFSRTCQACVPRDVREGGNCEIDWDCECEDGDRKRHECDCHLYYECKDCKEWVRHECEGGLHFNPKSKKCEKANEAGCK
ncbi:peritrophin-1-like [Anoplolepis gracilipes]|uniref:peritrophin-1-like n=1 Tax=Anoplolepis gracilipes TaxID=354296 RepID=UPI003B9FC0F9